MSDLITTALHADHVARGARMAAFAGFEMPIEFTGTLAEHEAVRTDVGLFDVSHLGTVWVEGPDALDVVDASFSNDPRRLDVGMSQYTLCCQDDGGIIDDLIVYQVTPERWMVVPNAANAADVVAVLTAAAAGRDASVRDEHTDWAILAVQGPNAFALVASAIGLDPREIPHLGLATLATDAGDAILVRTGYTGEPGCEIVAPAAAAQPLSDALVGAGATPAGLGARDTLRLEMGYPLHGNDIDRTTNGYEARLGWAIKLDDAAGNARTFPGADALRAIKESGPRRRLFGLLGDSRRPPRAGMTILRDGLRVGTVTSGSFSPGRGVGIGMGYLDDPIVPTGDDEEPVMVDVDVRGRNVPFTVIRPPFVDRSPKG